MDWYIGSVILYFISFWHIKKKTGCFLAGVYEGKIYPVDFVVGCIPYLNVCGMTFAWLLYFVTEQFRKMLDAKDPRDDNHRTNDANYEQYDPNDPNDSIGEYDE